MPHYILYHLYVHATFAKARTKCMSKNVRRNIGEQNWLSFIFCSELFFFIVISVHKPRECAVDIDGHQNPAPMVTKYKTGHTVNGVCAESSSVYWR